MKQFRLIGWGQPAVGCVIDGEVLGKGNPLLLQYGGRKQLIS